MGRLKLHWQMLIAILSAVLVGLWAGQDSVLLGIHLYDVFDFIGTLFLNALKMIIVPLVMSSIIAGVAGLGGSDNLGRLSAKTIAFYLSTSLLSITVGLLLVNLLTPGVIDGEAAGSRLNLSAPEAVAEQLAQVDGRGTGDITAVFLRMVPPNIIKAASDGQMLGLIFFSLLFGVFMTRITREYSQTMLSFWNGVYETMMQVTLFIMKFAPLGVFGLVAKTVSATGFAAFQPLLIFFCTVALGLAIHTFITLSLMLRLAGINPPRHYRAMLPAMLTAFSTASSSGTLPVTIECVEKNAGVSNRTSAFVLPLGATINMDGTALYECVAAMFIAQAYGLELSFATQFIVVLVALLTSIGVAGIPAASLVAITVILGVIGLPLEGIGMLLVTDRILDMMRTAVNVFSDSCGAVVIARSEGEHGVLT